MMVRNRKLDIPKLLFLGSILFLVSLSFFAFGVYMTLQSSKPRTFAMFLTRYFAEDEPKLINTPFAGSSGFEYFSNEIDDGYLLLSGYFPEEEVSAIKLLRISDGEIIKSWYPDPKKIREISNYSRFTDLDRFQPQIPLLMSDGGIVFIDNRGPLVRINRCSEIKWILDEEFYHSLEFDLDENGFVVPILLRDSKLPEKFRFIRDDGVARMSLEGKLLDTTSVAEMLLCKWISRLVVRHGL